jgi:hypothetical protein
LENNLHLVLQNLGRKSYEIHLRKISSVTPLKAAQAVWLPGYRPDSRRIGFPLPTEAVLSSSL